MKKTYYKATDKDMKCRGYQFKLGEWSDPVTGELDLCANGYHFCEHPSGVWVYYNDEGTRVFECEVEDAILSVKPGADAKSVCRRIRLVKEIFATENRNAENMNTGDRNTGDRNTGNCNTGNRNAGHHNTGHCNSGDRNTGNCNTGDYNTGDYNTGYCNTGHYNTGDYNTGDWNVGNNHTGYFGIGDAPVLMFGLPIKDGEKIDFFLARKLWEAGQSDSDFDVTPFLSLPNATEERIRAWHKALIEARKKNNVC